MRRVAAPAFLVLAVLDVTSGVLSAHDRQLLGAAHVLAGEAGAVVVLAPPGLAGLETAGADRVLTSAPSDGYDPDGKAAAVMTAIASLDPRHVLFAESADGGDLARRVAASGHFPLAAGIEALGANFAVRPCSAGRFEERAAPARLLSVAPDRIGGYAGLPCEALALPETPWPPGCPFAATIRSGDPSQLPLTEAAFVVAAGDGLTDFDMFARLVTALGATPGASRVLCDAGLMPRDRQVGASGSVLAAECYVAVGISGAPQHLAGITGVPHVIAVNTDLHAAMVARAGLAVIADAQDVMRALLAQLSA